MYILQSPVGAEAQQKAQNAALNCLFCYKNDLRPW